MEIADIKESRSAGNILGPKGFGATIAKFCRRIQVTEETEYRMDYLESWPIYFKNDHCTILSSKKKMAIKKGARYGVYSINLEEFNDSFYLTLIISNIYRTPPSLWIQCSNISSDMTVSELEELLEKIVSFQI